jgi:A/G-specific adenine glycosylase
MLMDSKIQMFKKRMLEWYSSNARAFSWRYIDNPYKIWIAETLLQQTDAAKVLQLYPKFIDKYPDIEFLANAEIEEVKSMLSRIGLVYRAERMITAAESILEKYCGIFPFSRSGLLHIKGIGDYIASAILCFAYGEVCPVVDVNVIRVIERVFGFKSVLSRPRNDKRVWEYAGELVDIKNPKDYNYALLDFAALICIAKNPICSRCFLNDICCYYFHTTRNNDV